MIVQLEAGTPRIEWCDRCLLSHAFMDVFSITEHGVSTVARWADHEEEDVD